jgi:hypothetical protein
VTLFRVRLASVLLMVAIAGLSSARAICLLSCALDAAAHHEQAVATGHCAAPASDAAQRLSPSDSSCGDCEQVEIGTADRRTMRVSPASEPLAVAAARTIEPPRALGRAPAPTAAPPPLTARLSAPLPLRI